jgi:hypothetical protein
MQMWLVLPTLVGCTVRPECDSGILEEIFSRPSANDGGREQLSPWAGTHRPADARGLTCTRPDISLPAERRSPHQQLDAVHERQVWLPEDPTRPGLIREGGKDENLGGDDAKVRIDGGTPTTAGADNTPYAQVAALPTDPDVLLKKIYAITEGRAPGRDAAAFDWVGETISEAIVPPKVEAAIWLAAGKIPGVEVVHDAVDAAGRHGEALAFESLNERSEYIFDKTTHTYLGERSYLVKAGKAGQLTGITAVLDRGVADKIGQVPSGGKA